MNAYGVKNMLELETAYRQMKDSVVIEACSRSYSVDVQNMEQKNTVTDVVRKVFRVQSSKFFCYTISTKCMKDIQESLCHSRWSLCLYRVHSIKP